MENHQYAVYIASLIDKRREGEPLSEREQQELEEWRRTSDREEEVYQELMDRRKLVAELRTLNAYDSAEAVATIFGRLGLRPMRRVIRWQGWAAAAAALLLAVAAVWMLQSRRDTAPAPVSVADIAAGGNKATLTLSNGTRVVLDTVRTGAKIDQDGAKVVKLADGRLAYEPGTKTKDLIYNTLTTPRGGQYQLTLPDGSRVWLNAASSITYPTAFTGRERVVKISGEVYMEVAAAGGMPFRVGAGGQEVEVLGTAFDINAYDDEPAVRTTLVEGKVRVRKGTTVKVLSPGEQAGAGLEVTSGVDVEQVLAWKNGAFAFRNADVRTVMRELARWYDIEVEYEGPAPSGTFDGEIGRGLTLKQVLEGLAQTRINYTIVNAHKIIIRP